VLDAVPGDPPVPVSVWRATGPDDPPVTADVIASGLTPRLAELLLGIWTDPGQLVLDATADPTVAGAAAAGARTYVALEPQGRRVPTADLRGQAALILLRWPPDLLALSGAPAPQAATIDQPKPSTTPTSLPGVPSPDPGPALRACRVLLAADGHTVVILAPPTDSHYRDYARDVIAAARHAGLGYLQHLVVITSDPHPTVAGTDWIAHSRAHVDLLVFVLRSRQPTTADANR
jgi:hypothetical protein